MNKKVAIWLVVAVVAVAAVIALSIPAPATMKLIGSAELAQLQAAGASVIDVRTPPEFEDGHIPSSVNVPVDSLAQAATSWDKDKPVIVYCATGARSADAASYLAGQGFRKVYDLEKGVVSWTGELAGGAATTAPGSGAGTVETGGKRLFIEFSTST